MTLNNATLLRAGLLAGAVAWFTLPANLPAQIPTPLVEFKLDEGAIDTSTNTTYSADGVFTGTFSGATPPLWLTTGLPPLLVAQTNTVAAITNSATGGYVLTTFYGTNASGSSVLGTNARTVCAWIQTAALPNASDSGYILTYGSVSSTVGGRFTVRLDITAGYVGKLRCEVSTGSVTATNANICDGNWHHIAVVSPASGHVSNLVVYVDANLQQLGNIGTPGTLINTTNLNPLYIGEYPPLNSTGTFLGGIDDVQIYAQALTQAQIAGLVYGPGNPPAITQQPQPTSVSLGSTNASATFSVAVSGSPTITYQWKQNGTNVPNATNQVLTISPVTQASLGAYSVGITNKYGYTNSAAVALTWNTPAADPLEETALVGSNAIFTVTMPADSTGYTYQWQQAGAAIAGATNSAYLLPTALLGSAGNYSVAVTLAGQSATSAPSALHVLAAPTSAYAQMILADQPSAYWRLGEANGAAVAVDVTAFHNGGYSNYTGVELQQAGALGGDADTASTFTGANWLEVPYAPALQHVNAFTVEAWVNPNAASGLQEVIDACNDSFFTHGYELAANGAVWLFRTGGSTSGASIIYNDIAAGTVTPGVWQHVVATFDGTHKNLYVDGVLVGTQVATNLPTPVVLRVGAGLPGQATPGNYLKGTLDEPAVYWHALTAGQVANHYMMGLAGPGVAPSFLTQPQTLQVILGDTNATATFSASVFGTPYFSYQWLSNGVALPGQNTATLTIPSAGTAGQANYSLAVTNGIAGIVSTNAALTYISAPIQPGGLALLAGGSGSFSVSMPAYQPYTYQWKLAGAILPGATAASLVFNNVSAANAGAYSVVVTLGATSVESRPASLAVIPLPTIPYAQVVSNDNPAVWWRLDDAPGSTTAADVFGANNGTVFAVQNDVLFGVPGALLGDNDTAAQFTGYSGGIRAGTAKIEVPLNTPLVSSVFSVECWAMVTGGTGNYRSPVTSSDTTGNDGYYFYASGLNTWDFWIGNGTGFVGFTGPAVVENQWVHLVGACDGANATYYVNGALMGSGPVAYVPNGMNPFRIGAGATDATADGFFFPGRIDEVAVYTNVLTAAQVQAHYAAAFFPANAAPRFTLSPQSRAVLSGDSYTLAASVQGEPVVTYQWQLAGTNLPGATNATLALSPVTTNAAGAYQLIATRGAGHATNSAAVITVLRGEAVSAAFEGNNPSTIASYGGRAGYVNATNWNEVGYLTAAGSTTGLINNHGLTNSLTVTWAASTYRWWSGPLTTTEGDLTMLDGFLDAGTSSNVVVTITGIPTNYQSAGYSLYAYMGEPSAALGIVNSYDTYGAVSLGTTTNFYHAIDLAFWNGAYLQATDTNPNDTTPPDANYAVFTNLNSASLTLVVTPHPTQPGPAGLSGFQLVSSYVAPPPALAITQQGNRVVLVWSGNSVLQSRGTLDNTTHWADVPAAASPYPVPTPLLGQQYYRLRSQ